MATVRQAIESQSDILNTIEQVKGKKYATFVRHSVGIGMIHNLIAGGGEKAFSLVVCSLMSDFAMALGIDLNDEATTKSIIVDVIAMQQHMEID